MTTPLFSLCHPTRRLPFGWTKAYEAWMSHAARPAQVEYILCFDSADLARKPLVWEPPMRIVINEGVQNSVAAWNCAGAAATGKFLISIADDLLPPWDWDAAITDMVPDMNGEYVLDVDYGDKAEPHFLFHSFLTRAYYERIGNRFWHPDYDGMLADNEFTDVAFRDKVVINARRLCFPHIHPSYGLRPDDEFDRRHQSPEAFRIGREVYARRKALGFPLEG